MGVAEPSSQEAFMFPVGDDRVPGGPPPLITVSLVILNVLAFLFELQSALRSAPIVHSGLGRCPARIHTSPRHRTDSRSRARARSSRRCARRMVFLSLVDMLLSDLTSGSPTSSSSKMGARSLRSPQGHSRGSRSCRRKCSRRASANGRKRSGRDTLRIVAIRRFRPSARPAVPRRAESERGDCRRLPDSGSSRSRRSSSCGVATV